MRVPIFKRLLEARDNPNADLHKLTTEIIDLADVMVSLHYDEKLLIDLWYKRNPCHELNSDSGEDMFWKTAFMVFEDYVREISHNDS